MLPETVPGDVASAPSALQHDRRDTSIVDAARMAHAGVEDGLTATGEMRSHHRCSAGTRACNAGQRSPVTPANRPEPSSPRRRGGRRRATTSKSISVVSK